MRRGMEKVIMPLSYFIIYEQEEKKKQQLIKWREKTYLYVKKEKESRK